ncbi:unnamed protein product [Lepeophtheirus salmonis]|uniref:(salmon louse) hypothetical protein n=1 Tax=Lepeophtheirus salmonis TaxID=72036 RepID=A0A7R8CUR5_LEPSM|nr:unnamed protein product [Lepeophtheirus salmonis]CAF2938702.1 unnamed protein product [Lepeophtheirus salmonis]
MWQGHIDIPIGLALDINASDGLVLNVSKDLGSLLGLGHEDRVSIYQLLHGDESAVDPIPGEKKICLEVCKCERRESGSFRIWLKNHHSGPFGIHESLKGDEILHGFSILLHANSLKIQQVSYNFKPLLGHTTHLESIRFRASNGTYEHFTLSNLHEVTKETFKMNFKVFRRMEEEERIFSTLLTNEFRVREVCCNNHVPLPYLTNRNFLELISSPDDLHYLEKPHEEKSSRSHTSNPALADLLSKPPYHASTAVPPPVPTKWHQEPREKLPRDIMRKYLPPHPAERSKLNTESHNTVNNTRSCTDTDHDPMLSEILDGVIDIQEKTPGSSRDIVQKRINLSDIEKFLSAAEAQQSVPTNHLYSSMVRNSSVGSNSVPRMNELLQVIPPNVTIPPNSVTDHSPNVLNVMSQRRPKFLIHSDLAKDYTEETNFHHLLIIASDWTINLNKLAANCRNISDEVFPGIHVGDKGAAKNAFYLKKVGISHVLNTAEGTRNGLVDTNAKFYKPLESTIREVSDYIDEALRNGGKVLVNCMMGMSRSSTCVLAYLMLRQNMTAVEALTEVRKHRDIRPNDGFLRQLADLDNKLRRERGLLK